MSYLLDADWMIQILAGERSAVSVVERLRGSRIATSWVAVAEVYEGAFSTPDPEIALTTARQLIGSFPIIDIGDLVVERFAQERSYLRRHGLLIPDMDLMIAATALVYDLTLLTFNRRHFQRVPYLRLYSPNA